MPELPSDVQAAIEECRRHLDEYWGDLGVDDEVAINPSCPLWRLVNALGNSGSDQQARSRLARLASFAARRALPCWEVYCDGDRPQRAVEAVGRYLSGDRTVGPWDELSVPAAPAYRGDPIGDCRFSDTSCVAQAAAHAVLYVAGSDIEDAYRCVGYADMAFDESPLGEDDHFREWLLDLAVPIAFAEREMTCLEQEALREYDASEIPRMRDQQADAEMAEE
jgi:hypothetical protein